jgi:hypothetical protein
MSQFAGSEDPASEERAVRPNGGRVVLVEAGSLDPAKSERLASRPAVIPGTLDELEKFLPRPHPRTPVRIVPNFRNQASADGVGNDVSDHFVQRLVTPKCAIEKALLPQAVVTFAGELKPGALFCHFDKPRDIRVAALTLDDEVQMVGHEAVRKNCHALNLRGVQDLRSDERNDVRVVEVFPPLECA